MPFLRPLRAALILAAALGVAGCGSSVGTQVPAWAGGLPPDAPQRGTARPQFPDVYDIPPRRPTRLMTEQEQASIEAELIAARNRVNRQADALERENADERR